jgi:hypothetical protein
MKKKKQPVAQIKHRYQKIIPRFRIKRVLHKMINNIIIKISWFRPTVLHYILKKQGLVNCGL